MNGEKYAKNGESGKSAENMITFRKILNLSGTIDYNIFALINHSFYSSKTFFSKNTFAILPDFDCLLLIWKENSNGCINDPACV